MARAPFPTFEVRRATSPDAIGSNHTADVPYALGDLGRSAAGLGAQLDDIAEKAAVQQGADQAAADVAAGRASHRGGLTIRAEAYNKVADAALATQRRAMITEAAGEVFAKHGENPIELAKGLDVARAAMGQTGNARVDAEVAGAWLTQRADLMARSAQAAQRAVEERGRANFLQDLQLGEAAIGRVAQGAPIDAGGAQRVAGAISELVQNLSKYGPTTEFEVAGVKFKADPNRLNALSPAQMQPLIAQATTQARSAWILAQAEQVSGEAAKRAFAGEVQSRWEKGDAAFAGIDGTQMVQLQRQLEAGADRARTEDRAARAEAHQAATDGIEAFRWGGAVDFDKVVASAEASGDAGLVAQAKFYRDADPATKGVLQTVYARQLGLVGGDPSGAVLVDAEGRPIARGARNNNPGNIEDGDFAKSLPGYAGSDGRFAIFRSPAEGAAAGKALLRSYGARGFDTVNEIVGRWAPAKDGNDVKAYAARVAAQLHIDPNAKLNLKDPALVDHLAAAMFAVETPGGPWATPPGVQPGTPVYAAFAATREGFVSDPLNYVRGGPNRPAIANTPVLVPEGAFAEGDAHTAWAGALQQRFQLGRQLSHDYGVPPRILTNQERELYKSQIEADPQRAVALAIVAKGSLGDAGALAFMRELGDSAGQASTHLHIADLAVTSPIFAKSAANGIALSVEGAKLPDQRAKDIREGFDDLRRALPPEVAVAAQNTAMAAALSDWKSGAEKSAGYYVRAALGGTAKDGRTYGGQATLNGAVTILPRWLASDQADEALERVGASWAAQGIGPVWANGEAVTGRQLANMRLQLTPAGLYRFVNPKTGNPLRNRQGRVMEVDMDKLRGFVGQQLGPRAVLGAGD